MPARHLLSKKSSISQKVSSDVPVPILSSKNTQEQTTQTFSPSLMHRFGQYAILPPTPMPPKSDGIVQRNEDPFSGSFIYPSRDEDVEMQGKRGQQISNATLIPRETDSLGWGKRRQQMSNAYNAITGPKIGPLPKGNRNDLDTVARESTSAFGQIVHYINQGMAINTEEPLVESKSREYKHLIPATDSGEITGSQAMFTSAKGWRKEDDPIAASLNIAGGVGLGFGESFAQVAENPFGQKDKDIVMEKMEQEGFTLGRNRKGRG